jgi:calpain-15
LCYGHAYTLIKLYKVQTKKGEERLIKLKNPWGDSEFTGQWSDNSKKWTPELKKQCEFSAEKDDGIFYMSFTDFMKYYMVIDIAKIKENYETTFCKVKKINLQLVKSLN